MKGAHLKHKFQKSINLIPWPVRDVIRHIPLVAPFQRWIVRRCAFGDFDHRITGGPASGVTFPINLPKDKLIWTGTYERKLAAAVQRAVRPGAVCLDIGAYRGFYAAVMGAAGASAIHLFEPNPDNVWRLKRLCELNPQLPLVVHQLAVGNKQGSATFNCLVDESMGILALHGRETETNQVATIEVLIDSLDNLAQQGIIPYPDVVKVDVEGSEVDVLMGAETILNERPPIWFIEAHSIELATRCEQLLGEFSYRIETWGSQKSEEVASRSAVHHLKARPLLR